MKSAIILVNAAALISALPYGPACAITAVTPEAKPAEGADGEKLPFIDAPPFSVDSCVMTSSPSMGQFTERSCGTKEFCEGFNDQKKMRDYLQADPKYKNAKDCLDARQNPKTNLRWITVTDIEACVASPIKTDKLCGTEYYCRMIGVLRNLTDMKFETEEECLAAHKRA